MYVRDMVAEQTVRVGGSRAVFQAMSGDGSRIFFLEGGELIMLDLGTGTPVMTDLTGNHGVGEVSAGVEDGVIGASDDGRSVYFVAHGVLASGATAGEENLYVVRESGGVWTTTYIASLSHEDMPDWNSYYFNETTSSIQIALEFVTSRVSPNGRYLAFMSDRSLTGYDNRDAVTGQPDEEVYLYDASSGSIVCASCDPTGARPVGVSASPVVNGKTWRELPVLLAGSVPGWDGSVSIGGSRYQPRYLTDNGRLFFDSPDALVPQDTNGRQDVYEYEPVGGGAGAQSDNCSMTSPTYVSSSAGCVSLISSGTSSSDSVFYDASETGDDLFFVTTGRLAPSDIDTSYDVYDAHVCSTVAPCVTAAVTPPPCTTSDSCRAAPATQPEIFGPGPSETFSGSTDVASSSKGGSRGVTRAQQLQRALKACRKSKGRRGRDACERRARVRYSRAPSRKARMVKGG
jgi:hypothetical protein